MNNIFKIPELQRDGNGQLDREILNRNPENLRIDARGVLDILHFFWQYSKYVRYYDINDGEKGDWLPFFKDNAPFQIALIAQFDPENWWASFQNHCEQVRNNGSLDQLMEYIYDMLFKWLNWNVGLENDKTIVAQTLKKLSISNVSPIIDEYVILYNTITDKFALNISRDIVLLMALSNGVKNRSTSDLEEDKAFQKTDDNIAQKRGNLQTLLPIFISFDGSNTGRLERLGELLYKALLVLRSSINDRFDDSNVIANDYNHAPHVGLLFAFLRLYKDAQGEINNMTQKHLDYFYKEILLFKSKAAIPDQAHLLFELSKHMQAGQLLKQGTLFKDGKDKNKAEIQFGLDEEIVVNKAKVEAIYTLNFPSNGFIYTNKLDISDPSKSWKTFGRAFGNNVENKISPKCNLPFIREKEEKRNNLSFVLASRALDLRDEVKSLLVKFSINGNWDSNLNRYIKIFTSGKKGWEAGSIDISSNSENEVEVKIINASPILPMNEAIHKEEGFKGSFSTLPAIKFELDTNSDISEALVVQFRKLLISNVTIDITSRLTKSLVIFNDEGNIDIGKPFMPFGIQNNLKLYFGAEEWIGKNITKIFISSHLDNEPKRFHFKNGEKIDSLVFDISCANLGKMTYIPRLEIDNNKDFTNWDIAKKETFANMNLNQSYFIDIAEYKTIIGHQSEAMVNFPVKKDNAFYQLNTNQNVINIGSEIGSVSPSYKVANVTLFPLLFKDFELSYNATSKSDITLIHLHPFDKTYRVIDEIKDTPFIADFKRSIQTDYESEKGALLLGLEDVQEGSNINLLFQFLPYSGNPDVVWGKVEWFILTKQNIWKLLTKGVDFFDDTVEFRQSGLIKVKIPLFLPPELLETPEQVEAGQITIMPNELTWLKASVENNPEAFDKLLYVHAQGAKVTFAPIEQNDLERLAVALEADKIKKLVVENAGIAKIKQPFLSFGGEAAEQSSSFYRRISEHLRHKGRGITLWDYEMLILQNFPNVYKAKALPHHYFKVEGNSIKGNCFDECKDQIINGNLPLFVTLVVVPEVGELPDEKEVRERPKVNRNTLEDIKDYFKGNEQKKWESRTSHFAHLIPINPEYIGVHLDFKVVFKIGKDENFYKNKLQEEIRTFLAPWKTGNSALIQFGGSLHFSSVLFFIEQREYVEYIHTFKMKNDEGVENEIIKTKCPYQIITNNLCDHKIEVLKC